MEKNRSTPMFTRIPMNVKTSVNNTMYAVSRISFVEQDLYKYKAVYSIDRVSV
ncbi:hypothetical protein WN55_11558 [Dufourea novaeangliae]|uniref:Uncharacterized protein n=1 Tax=Dufourea novaeangliae TaxID=178035 RepID=A0A154PCF5_DUFNO|nr:hypothetical protein WN55_11558 [Dufourea novaeangliae]